MNPSTFAHPARLTGLRPTLARVWLVLRHRILGRRYRRLVIETIDGVPLVTLPDVFNPVLFRGGALLAQTIAWHPLFAQARLRVLDLGCGSGVVAVFAARRGAQVTAVDINPAAVRCTRINALLNGLEDRIDARAGDLFAPIAGERFDLVIFNPPFFRGRPRNAFDHAWRGEQVFERFAAGLGAHLAADGQVWLLLSSDGAGAELLALLEGQNYQIEVVAERGWANEIMRIYAAHLAA